MHSSARVESKKKHVSNLQAGKPNYRGASPRDRKVRMRGDVAIVNGVSEMHVENAGKEQHFTIRYLAVYAKIADRWQMTAWQSTKVPDAESAHSRRDDGVQALLACLGAPPRVLLQAVLARMTRRMMFSPSAAMRFGMNPTES